MLVIPFMLRRLKAEAPPAPSQSPVNESLARGFLEALEAEYLHGTAEAVGKFFDKEGASEQVGLRIERREMIWWKFQKYSFIIVVIIIYYILLNIYILPIAICIYET